MTVAEFFPYPVNRQALSISCSLDGKGQVAGPGPLDLRELVADGVEKVKIQCDVSFDADSVLGVVLPKEETESPPVMVSAILRSIPSRIRKQIPLKEMGPGEWTGSFELRLDEVFHSAHLEPVLYRRVESDVARKANRAAHPGAKLAWGQPLRILFDYFAESGSSWLKMEWVDFAAEPKLEQYKDLLFLLDLEAPGELPVLRLNQGIDSLKQILMEPNRNSNLRRLRDSVGSSISLQAGTQLSLHVTSTLMAAGLGDGVGEPNVAELKEGLRDWERDVVSHWAPKLFPELGDEAEAEFIRWSVDPGRLGQLQNRLGVEVQRLTGASKSFSGLVHLKEKWGI